MTRYYTGIGSRSTPPPILDLMRNIAFNLGKAGYILRSGAADGADSAFEKGAIQAASKREIYLPWRRFNQHTSPFNSVSDEALEMAAAVHPAWTLCSQGAQKLHARNCYQVLGADLATPSEFVICWTPDGCESEELRSRSTGGTGLAIVLADRHDIPVFNLLNADSRHATDLWLHPRAE